MLSVSSTPGVSDVWLNETESVTQVQGSRYLDLCEEKPEILFKTCFQTPLRQKEHVNQFFLDFLPHYDVSVAEEYYHSVQSDLAFQKGIAKYCRRRERVPINTRDSSLADEWVYETVVPFTGQSPPVSIVDILDTATLDTSPGPFWRSFARTKRCSVLHEVGNEIFTTYKTEIGSCGSRCYFGGNLKDELRLMEKVVESKTRIFMSAPTEHFLYLNSLSYSFNNALIDAARYNLTPVAIGLPLFYGNVHAIGVALQDFFKIFCSDVGGYDTSITDEEHAFVANLRWLCFPPQYQTPVVFNSLVNLYRDVCNTPLVLPDGVVVLIKGQPSGQINTGIDNSLILLRRIFIVWLENGGPRCRETFFKHVFVRVAGDDSIIAVTEYGHQFVNSQSIRKSFELHYCCDVEFADQLEFLGHYFLYDGQTYLPGFSKARIFASLAYKGGNSASEALESALGLRVEAFTNPDALKLLDAYTSHLLERFPDLLGQYNQQFQSDHKIVQLLNGSAPGQTLQSRTNCFTICPMSQKKSNVKKTTTTTIIQPTSSNAGTGRRSRRNRRKKNQRTSSSNALVLHSGNQKEHMRNIGNGLDRGGIDFRSFTPKTQSNGIVTSGMAGSLSKSVLCDYLMMVLDPSNNMSRLPDSNPKRTAIKRSIMSFPVYVDPTTNGGRFSLRVRPTIGSLASAKLYKVALVRPTTVWASADWTSAGVYTATAPAGAIISDIRLDPLSNLLVGRAPGFYSAIRGGVGNAPFGSTVTVNPAALQNYNIPVKYSNNANVSRFSLPPGQYLVDIILPANVTPAVSITVNPESTHEDQFNTTYSIVGPTFMFHGTYLLNLVGDEPWFEFVPAAGVPVYSGGSITISTTYSPETLSEEFGTAMELDLNHGMVTEMRPIAMSVRFTCDQSLINTGGMCVSSFVTGGGDFKNYTTNNGTTSGGQLQYFDQLALVDKSSSSALLKGAYSYWHPESTEDSQFYTPSQHVQQDYGSIVVSGSYMPPTPTAVTVEVGRVLIHTVYEYITSAQSEELHSACCFSSELDPIKSFIANAPWSMENPQHGKFLQKAYEIATKFFSGAGKFYMANSDSINALAGQLFKVLTVV